MENMTLTVKKRKCLRCGQEYTSPYPPVINPSKNTEIACKDWCDKCNSTCMAALLRQGSAYWVQGGRPPWQGEIVIMVEVSK